MSRLDRVTGRASPNGNGAQPLEGLLTDLSQLRRRTTWETVQLARNVKRPHAFDVVTRVFKDFQELHGDRQFRDDPAIVAGIGLLDGKPVAVVGQQKGSTTEENIERNFGMAHPEGYRKALRVMRLAEKFGVPVVTLVDTSGAYPGPEAEERGQHEAIARNIFEMTRLRTPIVVIILGEGGSGGALALAVGDVVVAMENAIYSVISPEGAAAILWRTNAEAERAANALKLTSFDLLQLGVVDGIIAEPPDGAQSDHDETAKRVGGAIRAQLERLTRVPLNDLLALRYERFRHIGVHDEPTQTAPPPRRSWIERLLGR
ncbi:MAG TPA: acetyl-CoA carboxylase carboxyltransferase subunit alpha [Candidatus Limnocylindria bacterium]|nr:acetyl-CoA carboxylase carboxyltransferase subunit alpha [Candidatus Limnocylindria bacterium]